MHVSSATTLLLLCVACGDGTGIPRDTSSVEVASVERDSQTDSASENDVIRDVDVGPKRRSAATPKMSSMPQPNR